MRTVYLNGAYIPENEAQISIFDRGFLFADGVYEVTTVVDGKLIGFDGHIERLQRSLNELQMNHKVDREEMLEIHRELVSRNNIDQGMIYLQITRGNPGDRDFAFPPADTPITIVMFTQEKQVVGTSVETKGLKVVSVDDLRWEVVPDQVRCRHPDQDYIYRDELEGFAADGLCDLKVAFSRQEKLPIETSSVLLVHSNLL